MQVDVELKVKFHLADAEFYSIVQKKVQCLNKKSNCIFYLSEKWIVIEVAQYSKQPELIFVDTFA